MAKTVIFTEQFLEKVANFRCFDVCSVWPRQIFQFQAKLSIARPVFPDYLSVSHDYGLIDSSKGLLWKGTVCVTAIQEPIVKICEECLNPLMPGGNKKVTHTQTKLQLNGWPFCDPCLTFLLPPGIKGLKFIHIRWSCRLENHIEFETQRFNAFNPLCS